MGKAYNSRLEKEDIFGERGARFGDLLRLDFGREYEEIKDTQKLLKVLDEKQDDFLSGKSLARLIFFGEAVDHILKICRVLRQPRGSCMLIGVGGSGKQSLTRLSSFMLESQNRSIEIVKGFNIESFREFVKGLKQLTGVEGQQCTFLFTDTQIVSESFLEDINNLLNSGEVPNLWEPDEKKQITDAVREYHVKLGRVGPFFI